MKRFIVTVSEVIEGKRTSTRTGTFSNYRAAVRYAKTEVAFSGSIGIPAEAYIEGYEKLKGEKESRNIAEAAYSNAAGLTVY